MPVPRSERDLTRVLESVMRAEAGFAKALEREAPQPKGRDNDDLIDLYDRYIPSQEVKSIAYLFYLLDAYGVTTQETLTAFIQSHNEHIDSLLADGTYLRKWRLNRGRLNEARFKREAIRNAATIMRDSDVVAMDGATISRFLVEFANKAQTYEALDLLGRLGLLTKMEPAGFGSKVYKSTGRLEALYREYLATIANGCQPA